MTDRKPWGYCTMIDLAECDRDIIRSADEIKRFVVELCDLIDMKRFGEPVVINFGEDEAVAGFSMFQMIETSNISGHFVELDNSAFIDIFSCKSYDAEKAAAFTAEFFKSKASNLRTFDRIVPLI